MTTLGLARLDPAKFIRPNNPNPKLTRIFELGFRVFRHDIRKGRQIKEDKERRDSNAWRSCRINLGENVINNN